MVKGVEAEPKPLKRLFTIENCLSRDQDQRRQPKPSRTQKRAKEPAKVAPTGACKSLSIVGGAEGNWGERITHIKGIRRKNKRG